jgi:hypothetical protein
MWTLLLVSFATGLVLGVSAALSHLLLRPPTQEAQLS